LRGPSPATAAVVLMLAGCTASSEPSTAARCLLPGQQRMLVAELLFGRAIKGRAPLTDGEWAQFAAQTITPNFPDGFTVFDGAGQWRNPRNEQIGHEATKILLIAAKTAPDLARRLSVVVEAYELRFRQQSVGIITEEACAAFSS
jgi:Protein of unknown function (DUF3574)